MSPGEYTPIPEDHPLADPKARKKAIFTVAFTLFLDLMGFGIILPVLPYYAEEHGATATLVTLLSTAFSLAQFVMAPVLGRISDRYGRRPVMLISIAGSVAAGITLGFAHALWVVYLARIVAGASKANVSTAHAYVADMVEPKDRARYMGLMGAAMGMGFVFGPGLGGILSIESMPTLPFFASAALAAVNWVMAARWLPETRFMRRTREDVQSESKASVRRGGRPEGVSLFAYLNGTLMGLLVLITFAFYISFAGMESTMALYNQAVFGWGARETGYYMTLIGVTIVVVQGGLVGKAVDKFGEASTLAMGLFAVGLGLGLLAAVELVFRALGMAHLDPAGGASINALVLFGLGGVLLAGGNGLVSANISALVSRVSSPDRQGWNMGLKESAAALARIIGPVLAGPLFEFVAHPAPFVLGAVVALSAIVFVLMLRTQAREQGIA